MLSCKRVYTVKKLVGGFLGEGEGHYLGWQHLCSQIGRKKMDQSSSLP